MTSQTRDYNISWEQFNDAIEKFIDKSKLFNLNWSIKNVEVREIFFLAFLTDYTKFVIPSFFLMLQLINFFIAYTL